MTKNGDTAPGNPIGILAELTHRCPLACPYCSNPLELEGRETELDTQTWIRVFREAAELGILQAHLSGGEPAARRDLAEITRAASDAGIYTNLITSGIGVTRERLKSLAASGLDHVQISIQDSEAISADRIAGYQGAYKKKKQFAKDVAAEGMMLTINMVVHQANIERAGEMIELAIALGARRVEIAHVQYYGWALKNRAVLMPTREQVECAIPLVEDLKRRHKDSIVIDAVFPDYYARYPKACVGGWGQRSLNVTPSGKVLPCHAAETIPDLEFWSVKDHPLAEIWKSSPAFRAFRGEDWMQEPCRSCARRDRDFGGCRCQAFALTGDAAATDPVCHLSPHHGLLERLTNESRSCEFVYRR